jgi:hypothetical protein
VEAKEMAVKVKVRHSKGTTHCLVLLLLAWPAVVTLPLPNIKILSQFRRKK